MELTNNKVKVSGEIINSPKFSHKVFGESFYFFNIQSVRMSGVPDLIPVLISEREYDITDLNVGEYITIEGDFRSYNDRSGEKSRLLLFVFARSLYKDSRERSIDVNEITLRGFLCKPPIYRETPLGREITDILLAVNRPYRKSDYVPCIMWGRNARFTKGLNVGQELTLTGRVQSRQYAKVDLETQEKNIHTVYEISVLRFELL